MKPTDLKEDISRVERILADASDMEVRIALTRLLEVLRSWKVSLHIRKVHGI
jgi:hypothetical protein